MSSSFTAPRIDTAQFDEVKIKRLDLRQHAVERGPIQNTCLQPVFTLQLGHRRFKGRQGGRAKVARELNRVRPRNVLVYVTNGQDSLAENASPDGPQKKWTPSPAVPVPSADRAVRSRCRWHHSPGGWPWWRRKAAAKA